MSDEFQCLCRHCQGTAEKPCLNLERTNDREWVVKKLNGLVDELEARIKELEAIDAAWNSINSMNVDIHEKLEARVRELEVLEADLQVSLNRYQMEWAIHTARIKELEEAMPDPELLIVMAAYVKHGVLDNGEFTVIKKMADRIEKVMKE